ncbi:MAG: CRTAC1 family protein [Pyrinomonadaceae bacterium]
MFGDSFPLYRNSGGQFDDVTSGAAVTAATNRLTAWGNGIFDFDNDGWKDLFTANGAILDNSEEIDNLPYKIRNSLLRNSGNGKFVDLSAQVFNNTAAHRGAAFGDLDNDGRIDIVTNNLNDKPEILMNRSTAGHHWLMLNLIGTHSNRDGLAARIKVTTANGKTVQYNQVTSSVGYASSSDKRAHFGLGPAKLWTNWKSSGHSSGAAQILMKVKADQILTLKEPT